MGSLKRGWALTWENTVETTHSWRRVCTVCVCNDEYPLVCLSRPKFTFSPSYQVAACRAMTLLWHSSEWRDCGSCHQTRPPGRQVEREGGGGVEGGEKETGEGREVPVGTRDATKSNRTENDSIPSAEIACSDNIQPFTEGDNESPLPGSKAVPPGTGGPSPSECSQCDTRQQGPLLAALLTKLERLLDQVRLCLYRCVLIRYVLSV